MGLDRFGSSLTPDVQLAVVQVTPLSLRRLARRSLVRRLDREDDVTRLNLRHCCPMVGNSTSAVGLGGPEVSAGALLLERVILGDPPISHELGYSTVAVHRTTGPSVMAELGCSDRRSAGS